MISKLNLKLKIYIFIFTITLTTWNCSKQENINFDISHSPKNTIQIIEGKLSFDSKESLNFFIKQKTEIEFKNEINKLKNMGFNSLRPFFDENEQSEIDEYLKRKQSRIKTSNHLYSSKTISDEIGIDDEVINDDQFASILNEDREIYVGNEYFIYTTEGLFFCKIEDEAYLKEYLKKLNNSSTSKSIFGKSSSTLNEGPISLVPVEGEIIEIDSRISSFRTVEPLEEISYPEDEEYGGGFGGGYSSNTNINPIPMLNAQNFGTCTYSENSLFQQVFGNTIKCNDYFDDNHRIQTKVYNENYKLFATIGVSAKFQKKRFIGWSESSLSDGVRLGINHAVYTYNSPLSPYNPFDPNKVVVNYKGIGYDINGNVVPKFPVNPTIWPYPENQTIAQVDIEIFGNELYYELTGKDANKSINQLLSLIRTNFKSLGGDKKELVDKLEADNVGVNIIKFLPNKIKVVRVDILKSHSSQVKENFDTNFLLTLKNNSGANFQTLLDQFNAKKYDDLEIDIYGAALKNGIWKGKRIIGKL